MGLRFPFNEKGNPASREMGWSTTTLIPLGQEKVRIKSDQRTFKITISEENLDEELPPITSSMLGVLKDYTVDVDEKSYYKSFKQLK